jgi:hypothetical protein
MLARSSRLLTTDAKGAKIPPDLSGDCAIGLYYPIPQRAHDDDNLYQKWRLRLCLTTKKQNEGASI